MKVLKYPLLHHEKFRYPLLQSVKMALTPHFSLYGSRAIFQACSNPSKLS